MQHENHFVPRMYLKRWEDPKGKVWKYNLLVPKESEKIWKDYSVKAGMNYGLGFGVEIVNFSVGIIYDVTKFNVTLYNDAVIDGSLNQLSLSVGLIFGE